MKAIDSRRDDRRDYSLAMVAACLDLAAPHCPLSVEFAIPFMEMVRDGSAGILLEIKAMADNMSEDSDDEDMPGGIDDAMMTSSPGSNSDAMMTSSPGSDADATMTSSSGSDSDATMTSSSGSDDDATMKSSLGSDDDATMASSSGSNDDAAMANSSGSASGSSA